MEHGTLGLLGLSPSLLGGGTPRKSNTQYVDPPEAPWSGASLGLPQSLEKEISPETSPVLAAGAMPAFGAMPGA